MVKNNYSYEKYQREKAKKKKKEEKRLKKLNKNLIKEDKETENTALDPEEIGDTKEKE